jgi:amino acid adenylation domain-containing protein
VFGHKSVPLVVTLLGILKAGAAFLILDPRYPEARILAMMRAVSPQGFIHLEEAGDLPDGVRASLTTIPWHLNLSSSFGGLIDYSKIAPDVDIQPDDMAYIAFTSGTSGRPKGIIGNHRPLSHFFDWYQREFSLTANDRFSLLSGLAHDPLIRDIFAPLWVGGTLVIPEFEVFETESLGKWVEAEGITVAHLTPVMEQILSRGRADNCPSWPALRYLVFGGDRLQTSQVVRLQEQAPQVKIVNFYGATETPQAMAYYVISERAIPSSEWLPIGKGIADVQVLIINKGGQLAGIGEQGEICVRTPYLTQGYLHDEHLTQAKFIPNLFGARDANDYMYRTGDLGRYRPDGHVEILGRLDEQVKIRGVRIEPDEVMHVLSTHPSVHACFVMAREDNTDSPALVAYVVPTVDTAPTAFELRTYVAGQLPAAMIPSTYVFLEVLPYTPNGKIDRQALPLPDGEREKREVAFVAPRTPIEVAIAAIWQEVLKLDRVGIQDNFFDLGGHSLLAAQVVARVRDSLHIDLKLRHLFEVPTLKELAGTVEILQNSTQTHESSTDNTGEDRSEIVL